MKLVYFGNDLFSSCFDLFIERGWLVCALYINPIENIAAKMMEKAASLGIKVRTGKPSMQDMEELVRQGATLFFSAEYQHKIPTPAGLNYGVNMHTSLLPEGRGATPLPYLASSHRSHAGLTLHKLAERFDYGDIIMQQGYLGCRA